MIFIFPKVKEEMHSRSKLKIFHLQNLPPSKWGYFWTTFNLFAHNFLEVNSYSIIEVQKSFQLYFHSFLCYLFGFIYINVC
jgi:hypothetical protein